MKTKQIVIAMVVMAIVAVVYFAYFDKDDTAEKAATASKVRAANGGTTPASSDGRML